MEEATVRRRPRLTERSTVRRAARRDVARATGAAAPRHAVGSFNPPSSITFTLASLRSLSRSNRILVSGSSASASAYHANMAEAGQQRALTTAFAPPPPLWKHFTPDNLKKFEEIKKEASKGDDGKPKKKKWTPAELRSLDLPSELRFLAPPEIPTTGQYSVFGELQTVSVMVVGDRTATDGYIIALYESSSSKRPRHRAAVSRTLIRCRSRVRISAPAIESRALPPPN